MPGRTKGYSSVSGVVFLFNLIVGTGALALPSSIQKAGVLIGLVLLLILALLSFITVTFVVEALADGNALSKKAYQDQIGTAEATPLVRQDTQQDSDIFEISEKLEVGQLGVIITPKWCEVLIYFCLCVYLYGDLVIYETVVGRTGAYIFCKIDDNSTNSSDYVSDSIPCWTDSSITRKNFYRIVISIFVLLLGPFVFFNLQKTIALQIVTVFMRWLAFFIMIIWNCTRLVQLGVEGRPPVFDPMAFPTLFGTLVYSFMCQHSIPGLLQPIINKSHLQRLILTDYTLVASFYIALSITTVFAFETVKDILTLNYWEITKHGDFNFQRLLSYYLAFFPIFTLSTSFPIISITLRNNMRAMILKNTPFVWYYDRLLFPLLTILPPTALALVVSDLQILVGIIGSYAGTCIQYLIPCLLVYFGRKKTKDFRFPNKHASIFKHNFWIYIVYVWMIISLVLITVNYVIHYKK